MRKKYNNTEVKEVVEQKYCQCGGYPFVRVAWWEDNEYPCKDCYIREVERRYNSNKKERD